LVVGGQPGAALAFFFGDELDALAAFGGDAVAAVLIAGLDRYRLGLTATEPIPQLRIRFPPQGLASRAWFDVLGTLGFIGLVGLIGDRLLV
jgi:hypothetical protein